MTSTPPQQPAPPLGSPPGRHAIDVRGNQNVVVTGDVQGNITVTIGGRDVREQELAYLGWVVRQYEDLAARYTPLAGIVASAPGRRMSRSAA